MALPDINDLDLLSEPVEVDGSIPAEDFFSVPLPDDGDHIAVLSLGDRGVKPARQRDKNTGQQTGAAFLNVHVVAKLQNDDGTEGLTVFDNPTSIVMQNGQSKLHAILAICGAEVPPRTDLGNLKQITENTLAQKPRVKIYTQWEASIDRGAGKWDTVLKGQKRFPPLYDDDGNAIPGKYNPEVEDPKTGIKVRAQVRVLRYAKVQ